MSETYNHSERRAIEKLREIDETLKAHGACEALKVYAKTYRELDHGRMQAQIRIWLDRLGRLLINWHAGMMADVQDVFGQYGPRRARDVAFNAAIEHYKDKKLSRDYDRCEQALKDMAERRLVNTTDDEVFGLGFELPEVQSINEVSQSQLEKGRTF